MKRSCYALIIYSLCIDAYNIDVVYKELAKNPSFKGLSPLEIAADRDDAEGITHFALTADRNSLQQTIFTLRAQIDFTRQELERLDTLHSWHLGKSLNQVKTDLKTKITTLENQIATLEDSLKRLPTVETKTGS